MRSVNRKWKARVLQFPLSNSEREFWIWSLLGLGLFLLGKYIDIPTFYYLSTIKNPALDAAVLFLTERFIYVFLGIFFLVACWRLWKNPQHHSRLLPAFFAVMAAGIMAFILKSFFAVPRPYLTLALEPMVEAKSWSFPSAHTAVAFALVIPFWRINWFLGLSWTLLAIAMGFARVYENVHYVSDIAGGIFLGGSIGALFSHPEVIRFISYLWKDLEFRRQSFHFLAGFLCVFAHWVGILRLRFIFLLLLVGGILSYLSQYYRIPGISQILALFDRPRDKSFPGRGAFYFVLGVGLSFLFFPIKIAYAAILILSVGDSLNHLFFPRVQRVNLPWNRRKNIWGIIVGILAGTFAAQFFVPLFPALIASTIAILAETVPWRIGKFYIDDNILVPMIAGITLLILTS